MLQRRSDSVNPERVEPSIEIRPAVRATRSRPSVEFATGYRQQQAKHHETIERCKLPADRVLKLQEERHSAGKQLWKRDWNQKLFHFLLSLELFWSSCEWVLFLAFRRLSKI